MKAFIVIALFSYLGVAECLRCFECNSKVDSVCSDPFSLDSQTVSDAFLKTCNATDKDGNPSFCRKTKMWFKIDDHVRIHRDCGFLRREKYDCYQQRFEDHIVDVCQCSEDSCNGASQSAVAAGAVVAAVAVAFARL